MLRTLTVLFSVLVAFAGVLWTRTDGFRAFTSEAALRIDIAEHPRVLPPVLLQDQDGHTFRLSDYHDKPLLVDFIYTKCSGACSITGARFHRIAGENDSSHGPRPRLLSISFDRGHDGTAELAEYARHVGADRKVWRIARVVDEAELPLLLKVFGVVVVATRSGDFAHNAAINVIDRSGRLTRILDYDASAKAIAAALGSR